MTTSVTATSINEREFGSFSGTLTYTPGNGYRLKLSRDRFKRQIREAVRNDEFIDKLVHGMFVVR